jgi:hypothetical protein
MAVVPFSAAAHEHIEPAFDVTNTLSANSLNLGPFDVPAYGFLRSIYLLVTATGGTGGTPTADYPWNLLSEVTLLDVNGAPIFGPLSGYQAFLTNLYGGYNFRQDPRLAPDYASAATAFTFGIRIPVEIHHNNGLGALANQNAAAAYKVRLVMNNLANLYSAAPSVNASVRIRGYLEAWSQPTPNDLGGRPQAIAPPQHGTTQYWSVFSKIFNAGDNIVLLPRVGNLIRNLLFVFRDNTGARQAFANLPDPLEIRWDARQLIFEPKILRRQYTAERFILHPTLGEALGVEAGVIPYTFTHDVLGHAGDGTPELWLPTLQSTRLEFHSSSFVGTGTVEVLTNDVAPVEIAPDARFDEGSATGFHPAGVTVVGAN